MILSVSYYIIETGHWFKKYSANCEVLSLTKTYWDIGLHFHKTEWLLSYATQMYFLWEQNVFIVIKIPLWIIDII